MIDSYVVTILVCHLVLGLCEGQSSFPVSLENLLYRVDVGSTSQVNTKVVFHSRAHDSLKKQID